MKIALEAAEKIRYDTANPDADIVIDAIREALADHVQQRVNVFIEAAAIVLQSPSREAAVDELQRRALK